MTEGDLGREKQKILDKTLLEKWAIKEFIR